MHVLERLTNATNSCQINHESNHNLEKTDEGRGRNRAGTPGEIFGNAI